jgi:adenosylhomocysteine nucleosidase
MRGFRPIKRGVTDAYAATIGDAEVVVVLTGIGPKHAAFTASNAIGAERESLNFCVSSGLAGALRPEYGIGQVLAARRVLSERLHGDLPERVVESSAPLLSFAEELGVTVAANFYTAGHVVFRVDEKRHQAHTADAVEMESFEVLRQAAAHGIPAVAIRAISDVADEELPLDLNRVFDDAGRVSFLGVMGEVARHPKSIPGLIRLGQRSRLAAESLAKFLDRYVAFVAERSKNLEAQAAVAIQ